MSIDNENQTELFCEECGADFKIEHEMGLQYIPQYCPFCKEEIYDPTEEKYNEEDIDNDTVH